MLLQKVRNREVRRTSERDARMKDRRTRRIWRRSRKPRLWTEANAAPLDLPVIRLHELKFKIAIRLAAARTHFEPIANLRVHFSQRFVSCGGGNSNGAGVLAFVLRRPGAILFRNSTHKLHENN